MLGAIKGAEEVGIYTVAERGAHLIALIQTAVSVAVAPTLAELYGAGKMKQLQRVATRSAQMVLLVSTAIAVALIVFGKSFLLFFGSEFIQAYATLSILTAGYVVNTGMGVASLVLMMTKHERDAVLCTGVGVLINVALNAALIPNWGVEGAAAGTAISMMIRNVLAAILAHRRLGIYSTVLRGIRSRDEIKKG
jgi:O-antigen/teichoic acid export membrane protein